MSALDPLSIEPAVATAAELKLEAKQVAASKHRWAVSISLQLVGSMLTKFDENGDGVLSIEEYARDDRLYT